MTHMTSVEASVLEVEGCRAERYSIYLLFGDECRDVSFWR